MNTDRFNRLTGTALVTLITVVIAAWVTATLAAETSNEKAANGPLPGDVSLYRSMSRVARHDESHQTFRSTTSTAARRADK